MEPELSDDGEYDQFISDQEYDEALPADNAQEQFEIRSEIEVDERSEDE